MVDIARFRTNPQNIPNCNECKKPMTFIDFKDFGQYYFSCGDCISKAILTAKPSAIITDAKIKLAQQLSMFLKISFEEALVRISTMQG